MTDKYLLSIDPGLSTGLALLKYADETAPELVQAWQISDGAGGLETWLREYWIDSGWDQYNDEPQFPGFRGYKLQIMEDITTEDQDKYNPDWNEGDPEEEAYLIIPANLAVIAEKFNARSTGSFSYTTSSLEPLRCEGVLLAHNLPDKYVQPPQQYFAGGKGKADKKKRQHAALKDLGFYVTGSMVDSPDADDVRSAIAHGLSYLSRTGHKPTYTVLSKWNERNAA